MIVFGALVRMPDSQSEGHSL